jgi:hypothetical protein
MVETTTEGPDESKLAKKAKLKPTVDDKTKINRKA